MHYPEPVIDRRESATVEPWVMRPSSKNPDGTPAWYRD
jgi:hypothetical protein